MEDLTNSETTVVALFALSTPLEPIVDRLEEAGVPRGSMQVVSPLPLPGRQVRPSRRPLHHFTLLGGLAGIGLGLLLTVGTALLYPLKTGGKPIVSPPVVGIISFETMMLLGIITTFGALVLQLRSSGYAGPRDPRIDEGALALSVDLEAVTASAAAVKGILSAAGALTITRVTKQPAWEGRATPAQAGRRNEVWLWASWVISALLAASACSQDMETQQSYQSQEAPRRHSPPGSIPVHSRAVPPTPSRPPAEDRALGQRIFQINCVHCHGPQGSGDGPVAGYLRVLPKNLQAGPVQRQSAANLYASVTEGKDMMPPFKGELSAEERWAVVAYVQTLPELQHPTP